MRRIGLLGGMSWESSVEYERIINEEVRRRLGGASSADLIIRSYNFAEIEQLQQEGRWEEAGRILAADAVALERAGAEIILLCTNTMHTIAETIEDAIEATFVHIADATAAAIREGGLSTVGLLGTRYTMEQPFYVDRMRMRGIETLVPGEADREVLHEVIFDELVRGVISPTSRHAFVDVTDRLVARGAQGIIAGCTEIELLLRPSDLDVPYFQTTALHAIAAVDASLS